MTLLTSTKLLTALCLLIGFSGQAQFDYRATLKSEQNSHCLGTVLQVTSLHALGTIIWYRDGAAVATVTGTNSFSQSFRTVAGGHGFGNGANQLYPWGLFVDSVGNLYASDLQDARVQKWAPGAGQGVTVAGGNGEGNAASQLGRDPRGIAVDQAGNVYVADEDNSRVQQWAPGAREGTTVAGGHGQGDAADQLSNPFGVTLARNGDLYIADGNVRIVKWPPGAITGVPVLTAANGIILPWSTGFDGAGNLYVEEAAGSVAEYAPGAVSGISLGNLSGLMFSPTGMFVDHGGDVYIDNNFDGRILEWVPATGSWTVVADTHFQPSGSQLTSNYTGVFVDGRGNLYVGDGSQARVLKFDRQVTIDTTYTPPVAGVYTALVIDVNGDTTITPPFTVNAPFSGELPSIGIGASSTSSFLCAPITFTATAAPGAAMNPVYRWQVSGVNVGGDSLVYSNNLFASGDRVWCIMTTDTGCSATPLSDTSNVITLSIDPQGHATVGIAASDTAVCAGTPITFTASVQNGATDPGFNWLVNGVAVGDSASTYTDSNATGGQVVYCLITSDASCGLAKSNSIAVTTYPLPAVASGQVVTIPYGKSEQLEPILTGDIASYSWTPAAGLSDTTIRDPVADPAVTTVYTLSLVSFGGCAASGTITVERYTPLRLPNAFTPNGDGRNSRFYVLGGPVNSQVEAFIVFNRQGAEVFQVHGVAPGDAASGWDGTFHGHAAAAGTYVYFVVLELAGGARERYKGTVELVR
jgi:gliding motility-associated-like protein